MVNLCKASTNSFQQMVLRQKGIIALLMREADMPFTLDGVKPCFIFNPHGLPSRMTAG